MSRSSTSGISHKVGTWLQSQAGNSSGSLEGSANSHSSAGLSSSIGDNHGPPFTTPPPSPLHSLPIDIPGNPSEKVDIPTEPNSPDPNVNDATHIREYLKRIPATQMAELFNEKLTLQVSLGEILSRWSHGVKIIDIAPVVPGDPISSHPTTDTLGSQINNPLLRSVGSLLAAELSFKYPDPRATLQDIDKIEDPRWLKPAEPAPLPPLSELPSVPSRPPSYGNPVLGSASSQNIPLPEDDVFLGQVERRSLLLQDERKEESVNEFIVLIQQFAEEEVAETIRILSTFNPEEYNTNNIEALKTTRNQALSVLGSYPRSIVDAMLEVHPDAWDLRSPEWKRKWDSNMETLYSSMSMIRKNFTIPLESESRSTKSQIRHVRHLTTHLEDEVDEIEARVGSFKRLFLTLQAKYLTKQLREVKEALRKSRDEAERGTAYDDELL